MTVRNRATAVGASGAVYVHRHVSPVRVGHVARTPRPYWDAIPETERERIAAAIPPNHVIYVAPGYWAKPGTADVSLRREVTRDSGFPSWEVVRQERGRDIAGLCWRVLAGVTA
jgi:hypothetical protein